MVQEFHVLRCFSCESFQVQQVKKANRWSCKMCGEKQSLLKEFGRGSGADCRRHVQKLNAMRGAMIEKQEDNTWSLWEQEEADGEEPEQEPDDQVGQTQVSRWNRYLAAPEEAEPESKPEEDGVLMDKQQLHGNNMTDRKKRTDTRHHEPTPAQLSCSRLRRKLVGPSTTTTSLTQSGLTQSGLTQSGLTQSSPPGLTQSGLTQSSPPSLTQSGLTRSSPPSKKRVTGPASRWTQFLSSACQVQEGAGLPMNGATSLSNEVTRPRPLPSSLSNEVTRPRPLPISLFNEVTWPRPLPGSSLFETGEEFSLEDEDLNQ